jgi:hypothetical protein
MASVIQQQGASDCAIAALANLASSLSYDAITEAGERVEPRWKGRRGFYNREVIGIARRFAIVLKPRRRYNLDHDAGVLRVRWNTRHARAQAGQREHFVCVRHGLILDPADGTATPWRQYVADRGVALLTLLRY